MWIISAEIWASFNSGKSIDSYKETVSGAELLSTVGTGYPMIELVHAKIHYQWKIRPQSIGVD